MKTIYLAGPITGQNYEDATKWREVVRDEFEHTPIITYSPMRSKHYLSEVNDLTFEDFGHHLSTSRTIMTRDFMDAKGADLILINFDVPHPSPSLGTVMEIAWAYQLHKPVIAVDSPKFQYSKHPMIMESVTIWAKNLEEAMALTRSMLLSDTGE